MRLVVKYQYVRMYCVFVSEYMSLYVADLSTNYVVINTLCCIHTYVTHVLCIYCTCDTVQILQCILSSAIKLNHIHMVQSAKGLDLCT